MTLVRAVTTFTFPPNNYPLLARTYYFKIICRSLVTHASRRSTSLPYDEARNITTTSALHESARQNAESVSIQGTKLGVIGYGKMSGALVGGFLNAGVLSTADIYASVRSQERKTQLIEMGIENVFDDALHGGAESIAQESNVIMIGVKPQVIKPVLLALAPHLKPKHLIVSIAAGITLSELEESLGHGARVIRVMPNTPSLCQQGASAYALGAYAGEKDASIVHELLSNVGIAIKVQEKMMDGVTGVSGSGPAYIYMMIEAMADGGVMAGLPRETAMILAAQTAKGAAEMVLNGEGQGLIHPGVLKDQVASPAGATIAAIAALENAGMRAAFIKAVMASAKRSEELG